ncbi:hypothetical protein PAHAL_4G237800 [Panicum hallii]|uniref:Uncharacterized protein n=1 Tax=Panicum hallii TaxID=206008 RepID=A0A2T8JDT0_9POAL|nr:hypothetical protein PAHAL_4G237800 [Panicum hallii]
MSPPAPFQIATESWQANQIRRRSSLFRRCPSPRRHAALAPLWCHLGPASPPAPPACPASPPAPPPGPAVSLASDQRRRNIAPPPKHQEPSSSSSGTTASSSSSATMASNCSYSTQTHAVVV